MARAKLSPRPDEPASLAFSGFARHVGGMHQREHLLELRLGQVPRQAHAPQLARGKARRLEFGLEIQPLARFAKLAMRKAERLTVRRV